MSTIATSDVHPFVVLVVEDEFLIREAIAVSLRDAGYAVIETGSGEEAIALCKSDRTIHIVFTDINLVGAASGLDVAECFRILRGAVPVIVTSGRPTGGTLMGSGQAFVAKPYRHADVLTACKQLIGNSSN